MLRRVDCSRFETELEGSRLGQREHGGFRLALKNLSCSRLREAELVDSKLGQSKLRVIN